MPHVAEHTEEDNPLTFDFREEGISGTDKPLTFDFGVGQGRTQQKYVIENNSEVTMPFGSSPSYDSRESKETIEGREGFFGNTSIFDLGAPGGFAELEDIKKLPGGLIEAFVTTITGGLRERAILGRERQAFTPENIEAAGTEIRSLVTEASIDLSKGEFRSGVSKLFEAFGRIKQVAPPVVTGPFGLVVDFVIQENPEVAQRFNDKMLELQVANEDFLIRNGLMFGPDDEPTIVGNLLSQIGLTGAAIGGAVLLKSPVVPALVFGAVQQVSGFKEAEKAGKDPFTAAAIGDVQGIIEGTISFLELGQLTKIISSGSTSIATKIIAGMIAEGIEEGVTEALIASVQNLTGVKDMTLDEALNTVFQAVFYGSIAGGGVTGSISIVRRMTGSTQENAEKIARVMDGVASDTALDALEQAIDDAETELEIGRDNASGQPVTKAAKATAEQQKRVVEILQKVNEGEDVDLRATLDEIFPEARVQREKQRLEQDRSQRARTFTKRGIKEAVGQIQAEIQIAEQQGNEEEAARLSEELDRIQQLSFTDESVRAAVEELQAEGIFIPGSEVFERAVEDIDDLLRPLRAGVRVGRALQKEESAALQKSLLGIIDKLAKKPKVGQAIIDTKTASRLKNKAAKATTVKNAESIRRDIISQARKAAFGKFKRERIESIRNTIKTLADKKVGELDPDSQNIIDAMNKMRKGRESAREAKGFPPQKERTPEQKKQAKESIEQQTVDFNIEQSRRIESDMGQGIPAEGVVLQVRYLDILNEKAKATPNAIAKFEDDLTAFIATGKGKATAAKAEDQKLIDATLRQAFLNEVKDLRASIENSTLVEASVVIDLFLKTHETAIRALGLKGTVFDLVKEELQWREERQLRRKEMRELADKIAPDGDGKTYLIELSKKKGNVIDVPRKGHTAELGGKQSSRIKMTRGQLVYARMLLEEKAIEEQIRNPEGRMAWTDKFIDMINERLTDEDRAFIKGLFEIYATSYERFNEAYRDIYNRDLTRVKFYSHIQREGKDGQEKSAHTETVLIDMLAVEGTEGSLIFPPREPSEAKTRVDASSEIRIRNVIEVFDNYNYDVEHFIALGKKLSLQDKILRDKEFVKHIREILGEAGFDNLIQHIKIIARSNQRSKDADNALRKLFEFFRGNFFKAILLANPKIGLGQTATSVAALSEMPAANFLAGAKEYITNPKKANARLDKHPTFGNRELNFNPEIEQVGGFGTVLNFLNLPSRKGDGFGARVTGHAIVKFLMEEKGFSEKDALGAAAEFVERSQQSTLLTQRTLAQKSDDPLTRTLTMFTSSPVAMLNVSMQAIREYRQSDTSTPKKKAAARKKLIKTVAIQNLYIPALYAVITGKSVASIAGGSLGGAPIIGDLLTVIAEIFLNIWREEDERVFTEGPVADIPLSEALSDIYKAAEKLTEEDVTLVEYIEALVPIAEAFSGFPIDNVMDITKGAMELFDTDDKLDAALQMGNYGDAARRRTLNRVDLLTGSESDQNSGRILTPGAF